MKIKKVILDNIRCFDHIEIDFTGDKGPKDWIVVLGDNGVGKTTILRSIAIGLTEVSSGLLTELDGDWIRKDCSIGKIRIDIEPYPGCNENAYIFTEFKKTKFDEVEEKQTVAPDKPKSFNWDDLFVCGYGAARTHHGTESYSEYNITDSIYTLFKYSQALQNPELMVRRIQSLGIDERAIFKQLEPILMLEEGAITLDISGIKVSGPWGEMMPMGALGDGYRATMSWILDVFGWKSLDEGKRNEVSIDRIVNISGIVLLDEIEQHLHPKWQKEIVRRLHQQFPKIQFIITTHSPLIAMNSYSLDPKLNSKHFVLNWEGNKVVVSEVREPMSDLGYDQLLGSEAFGHIYSQNTEVEELLEEMSKLASKDELDPLDQKLLDTLKSKLKEVMFPEGKTLIERIVEREYYSELEKRTQEFNNLIDKYRKKK